MLLRVVSVSGWSAAEHPLEVGQQRLEERSAPRASPVSPVQAAMLLRVVSVSG